MFLHLIMCITYLIFFRGCFCCTKIFCVAFEYMDSLKTACVRVPLIIVTEIRQKTLWWVEAIHFTSTSSMCDPSCLFSCQGVFFFCFVLFCPSIIHVAASEITVPLSQRGPLANREDLLPGDTGCSVGSSVQCGRCFSV